MKIYPWLQNELKNSFKWKLTDTKSYSTQMKDSHTLRGCSWVVTFTYLSKRVFWLMWESLKNKHSLNRKHLFGLRFPNDGSVWHSVLLNHARVPDCLVACFAERRNSPLKRTAPECCLFALSLKLTQRDFGELWVTRI